MENLKELFLEHQQRVSDNLPEIKHVDLWSEQVSFMADEHPFKAPAVFFSYRILEATDQGEKNQLLKLQVEIYVYYETFADTARNSKTQNKALDFLDMMTKVNACFHGCSGQYFAEMRRTGFNPVETGTANLLYLMKYECSTVDSSAQVIWENMKFKNMEMEIEKTITTVPANAGLYDDIYE